MAAIKSYTDIEQSKKLAEILPLESADMLFQLGEDKYADSIKVPLTKKHWEQMMPDINPCWSLAALLSVLPPKIGAEEPMVIKMYYASEPKERYICQYSLTNITGEYNNPVDACYEMILKLNELKML